MWGFGLSFWVSFGASGWHPEASLLYFFSTRFPTLVVTRVGNGDSKRQSVTPGRPGASSHLIPDPGHPTPRRWKRLRPPSSEGEGGEVGVPRNLFPRLGVG